MLVITRGYLETPPVNSDHPIHLRHLDRRTSAAFHDAQLRLTDRTRRHEERWSSWSRQDDMGFFWWLMHVVVEIWLKTWWNVPFVEIWLCISEMGPCSCWNVLENKKNMVNSMVNYIYILTISILHATIVVKTSNMENLASGNQTWQAEKYIVDIPLPCLINRGVVNLSLKSMRKMLLFFFRKNDGFFHKNSCSKLW
jgi:hypothetical protein